ncbi:hypothetical protein QE441_002161 [Chryseobacterium sp. SORGH_AS909]|uniref:Uncharacterized protein n=1 Tax=Chryseobacterium camelliae TaxID=1265445 RepID=A0ABU0TDC7_9FLAO|nr:hypothetical protein [Chryseobacterium camelliae]MDQ1099019.1 hypothetical protein [Chryseobacterium sp. SORGH_AS_1048]MDR6086367.1 hypothetical protein [Chryseobacterium sp. SORGH_AS_0909]MDR6130740.1 hypothetical protein [Chryseobacterium sp. SORGH_AS_1175]MDT3407128.1 hypothetical protein [Pseudacidovorax intermedius]
MFNSHFQISTLLNFQIIPYLCIHEKIGLLIPLAGVGKSGHHRAAKRITSVTREGRTSATESRYSSAVVKPGKLFAVQW